MMGGIIFGRLVPNATEGIPSTQLHINMPLPRLLPCFLSWCAMQKQHMNVVFISTWYSNRTDEHWLTKKTNIMKEGYHRTPS